MITELEYAVFKKEKKDFGTKNNTANSDSDLGKLSKQYKGNMMKIIESTVASEFPSVKDVGKASFEVHWDVQEFVTAYRTGSPDRKLQDMVVVTGDSRKAQTTTVASYLRQTWGQNSNVLIDLLQQALEKPGELLSSMTGPGSIGVNVGVFKGSIVKVNAIGSKALLCAAGQQIAWLSSACKVAGSRQRVCETVWEVAPNRVGPTIATYRVYSRILYSSDEIKDLTTDPRFQSRHTLGVLEIVLRPSPWSKTIAKGFPVS